MEFALSEPYGLARIPHHSHSVGGVFRRVRRTPCVARPAALAHLSGCLSTIEIRPLPNLLDKSRVIV